ncbi:helix-turn-helix transcriptional regulator [Jiangella alkaliphila]|uniref:Regulatory protein, luxR family n=1 Tax=Jiangella alkaliphila TaxID=419479 RepID=A0A1H2GWQ4_9ACTN|nr:helix-turn-helix transcriptional regulator [Jiangella alkaliphila]SDU24002.1 regulatory protein, luxR family [Jiangella alkaliphila]
MATLPVARARRDLTTLLDDGLGVGDFSLRAAEVIRRSVPFAGVCVLTMDPASLLPTGEVVVDGLPAHSRTRLAEIELLESDVNTYAQLVRQPIPAASLSAATGGELDRSLRQRELRRPAGFGDELRAVLVGETGTWGAVTLLREAGDPWFTLREVGFVAALSRVLAEGVQRALLVAATDAAPDDDTGMLVVGAEMTVTGSDPAAERWLDDLRVAGAGPRELPVAVRAVVSRARLGAASASPGRAAYGRARTRSGRWVSLRASLLDPGDRQVTVALQAAGPRELAPLIADVYGLTERERVITGLIAQGRPTQRIAADLHLSPYTVQDHLKSIFDKTGASSRGELVARIYLGEPG